MLFFFQSNREGMLMNICIPHERRESDYRVALTPAGVKLLVQAGHTCYVEHDAGVGSGFSDYDYQQVGGQIAYRGEEIYGRADLLLKVSRPTADEFEWLREDSIVTGFLHLASASQTKISLLTEKRITAIGWEIIQEQDGRLPVLEPISQVAGRMIPQVAASLAQNNYGGKGILLGGVPGVPRAEVVILGGGTVGRAASRTFLGLGATVYVLDQDFQRLRVLDRDSGGRIITMVAHDFNIEKVCKFADVLVGAVLVPGERSPIVVTREMVKSMRPRSIIMDISIDQGGCVETSRPTTHDNPTYIVEDVIHYCVPNMTGVLGRTATHALNNATWPFIQMISEIGIDHAIDQTPALAKGIYTRQGQIVHRVLKQAYQSGS
jgi:alanine dehydrogenase